MKEVAGWGTFFDRRIICLLGSRRLRRVRVHSFLLLLLVAAYVQSDWITDAVFVTVYKDLPHPPAGYLPLPPGASSYPSTISTAYSTSTSNGHANGSAQSHAHGAHQPYAQPSAPGSAQGYNRRPYAARSADGTGYSSVTPDMGAAHRPYARTVPPIHPYPSSRWPDAGLLFDSLLARRPSDSRAGVRPSSDVNATPGHTTLPPTDAQGFARQPGGLSSLFFAFADLVIHSVFNTSHAQWGVNDVSSYLDLSPLYGSSEADNAKVRQVDGTGRLWEDVWADGRVLFMPPSVPALLVLFGRNHNVRCLSPCCGFSN